MLLFIRDGWKSEIRMKVEKVCARIKRVLKCKSLGMNAKSRLYEGIVVLTALYGANTWYMGAA